VSVIRSVRYEYRLTDGTVVDAATVAPWLPSREEGARQMVTKKVVWRKYDLANLATVSIGAEVTDGVKKAAWDAAIAGDAPRVKEIIATLSPSPTVEGVESEEVDG